jgi:DNA-binding NarL/FixJ family response regulator
LLVDDHAMMRQGLRSVLEGYSDVSVVGEASDGQEAVEAAHQLLPSIVVMDINMPGVNGIEATKRIKMVHPEIIVIGLSVNAGLDNQTTMCAAGAHIVLTKEAAVAELYVTIQEALHKDSHLA